MKLLTIYQGYCPDVIEIWHPDLRRILDRNFKVIVLTKKNKSVEIVREPVLEYRTNIVGTIYTDGYRKQKSTTKVRFV